MGIFFISACYGRALKAVNIRLDWPSLGRLQLLGDTPLGLTITIHIISSIIIITCLHIPNWTCVENKPGTQGLCCVLGLLVMALVSVFCSCDLWHHSRCAKALGYRHYDAIVSVSTCDCKLNAFIHNMSVLYLRASVCMKLVLLFSSHLPQYSCLLCLSLWHQQFVESVP